MPQYKYYTKNGRFYNPPVYLRFFRVVVPWCTPIRLLNTLIPIILTQSSRRRGERGINIKLRVSYILFLLFIMKISTKEKFDFLSTHSSLRPLRLCVKNYRVKFMTLRNTTPMNTLFWLHEEHYQDQSQLRQTCYCHRRLL